MTSHARASCPHRLFAASLSQTFSHGSHTRGESIHRLRHIFAHLWHSWVRYALIQCNNSRIYKPWQVSLLSLVPKGNHVTPSLARGRHASKSDELVYRPFIYVLLPHIGGPSLHRLRICFSAIATSLSKQQPWIEACSFPASQRMFPLHLVLSLHRSGITTRPTSPCTYFHGDRGISHERVSEFELQTTEKTV